MRNWGLWVCLSCFLCLSVKADDAVLIRMKGRTVNLSEFLWYFQRTAEAKDVDGYFNRFLRYQLKVADAAGRQLDTLPDFRRQDALLQTLVLKKHFMNGQLTDSLYRQVIDELQERRTEKEWMKVDVFTFPLSQHATVQEEQEANRCMNELAARLNQANGLNKENVSWAAEHGIRQDVQSMAWTPANRLLKELVHQQANLEIGRWSAPFYSPLGIQLLRVLARSTSAQQEWNPAIHRYVDQLGSNSPLFDGKAYHQWLKGNYTLPTEVVRELAEVHDGLLAVYWEHYEQKCSQSPQEVSPHALAEFFKKNKSAYRWEYPHFKGAVIHCLNKKAASKIKKTLKKVPMPLWKEALQQLQENQPKYTCEIETGLFQIGTDRKSVV